MSRTRVVPVKILPGIFKESSDIGAEGRYIDADRVRFRSGLPETIGGWQKTSNNQSLGKTRGLVGWRALDASRNLAAGTHLKLYVWRGGTPYDITPVRATGTATTDPFITASGSSVVEVRITTHGAIPNDYVTFPSSTVVNGVTLTGEYQVQTASDANGFTINATDTATGTGAGGGAAVTYSFQINTGEEHGSIGLGWGAGTYGFGTYGTPRSSSSISIILRTWSLANWGEDLIANPRGGSIYVWDTSVGVATNPATLITQAPSTAQFILVTPDSRHLVAYGAHDGTAANPLNIRWCTREDYTDWTPTAINSAGTKLLDSGSSIVTAVRTHREIVIFTDVGLHSQQFVGGNEVFSFFHLGTHGGIRGPLAAIEHQGVVFWMGDEDFWIYDGRVQPIPCDVRKFVFDNIDTLQSSKVVAGVNRNFNEIWWFYQDNDSTTDEVNRYVVYNFVEKTWFIGELDRTSWIDRSELTTVPLAVGTSGYLYEHEVGIQANGQPLNWFLETGDFDFGEGDDFFFINGYIPDFQTLSETVDFTIKTRRYPNSGQISKGPLLLTATTEHVKLRARGRAAALRWESSDLNSDFRLGTVRLRVRPDGRR